MKSKTFVFAEVTIKSVKREAPEWDIFASHVSVGGPVSLTCKGQLQLNNKKANNPTEHREKDWNRHFSTEDVQIANKHVKTRAPKPTEKQLIKTPCATSHPQDRHNQTGRDQQILLKVEGIAETPASRKGQRLQSLWEAAWPFLETVNVQFTYDPAILLRAVQGLTMMFANSLQ